VGRKRAGIVGRMVKAVINNSPDNTTSKSKMISRRQGGGDETYCPYVEEADDAANKDSALI
jgi:hypothetical protein